MKRVDTNTKNRDFYDGLAGKCATCYQYRIDNTLRLAEIADIIRYQRWEINVLLGMCYLHRWRNARTCARAIMRYSCVTHTLKITWSSGCFFLSCQVSAHQPCRTSQDVKKLVARHTCSVFDLAWSRQFLHDRARLYARSRFFTRPKMKIDTYRGSGVADRKIGRCRFRVGVQSEKRYRH